MARTSRPTLRTPIPANHVIILNADKIALTGNKFGQGTVHALRSFRVACVAIATPSCSRPIPERIIKSAIKGMLPKNRLAKVQLDRLHIVRGAEHPYAGMKPQGFSRSLRSRSRLSEPKGDKKHG